MSDERKFIEFNLRSSAITGGSDKMFIDATFTGWTDDEELAHVIQKKLGGGLKVYENDGLVGEALALVKAELDKEKQRSLDLERLWQAKVAELEQQLSWVRADADCSRNENRRLVAENTQMKGTIRALDELAELRVDMLR